MKEELINKFGLRFENTILSIQGFSSEIFKVASANNVVLGSFLTEWRDVDEINESLLFDIDNVLINNVTDDTASETVGVILSSDDSKLFNLLDTNSSPINPDFVLPTTEFKEIIVAWKAFLLQTPLSGTKI